MKNNRHTFSSVKKKNKLTRCKVPEYDVQANQTLIARTATNTACLKAVRGSTFQWLATREEGKNKEIFNQPEGTLYPVFSFSTLRLPFPSP
jgi:hypothetical protein